MDREAPEQQPFSKWILDPQTLIGLSAVLLSLCGLFIAIYEASLIRQAQRASVWPHVEVAVSSTGESLTLIVNNTGVGPALIQAAALTYKGEVLQDWLDLARTVGDNPPRINYYWSTISGRVLPAQTRRERIFALSEEYGAGALDLMPVLRREIFDGNVDITVCYCSVYEECWTTSLQDLMQRSRDGERPTGSQAVESCETATQSGI